MPALEVSSTISKWQKLLRRCWPLTAAGYVFGHVPSRDGCRGARLARVTPRCMRASISHRRSREASGSSVRFCSLCLQLLGLMHILVHLRLLLLLRVRWPRP